MARFFCVGYSQQALTCPVSSPKAIPGGCFVAKDVPKVMVSISNSFIACGYAKVAISSRLAVDQHLLVQTGSSHRTSNACWYSPVKQTGREGSKAFSTEEKRSNFARSAGGQQISHFELQNGHEFATSSASMLADSSGHIQEETKERRYLKDMSYTEVEDFVVKELGDDTKRAKALWAWLYRHGRWAKGPSDMEGVSRSFLEKFGAGVEFDSLVLDGIRKGRDGTRKLTFRLKEGGGGVVETVLIPSPELRRHTVCISSQLGCAMGCRFCFTAKMGLQRNLSVGQMVDQLVQTRRLLSAEVGLITNVVFMGMGEPLHNLDNVLKAVDTMVDLNGLQLAAPRITVSTSGLVPEIRQFCRKSPASLAVSINATTDEVRNEIMPVNRRHNLEALLGVLRAEFPRSKRQNHVFLEYIMLAGVNDSIEDAHRLLELTAGLPCKINLIMFNPHEGTQFSPSPEEVVNRFRDILVQGGRRVFVRHSRGDDEMAACGQLGQPGSRSGSLQPV